MVDLLACLYFRWTRGGTVFLDRINKILRIHEINPVHLENHVNHVKDYSHHRDRQPHCDGPALGCSVADSGEEWVWNISNTELEGLVHARERRDDGSLLPDIGCAERGDVPVWCDARARSRERDHPHDSSTGTTEPRVAHVQTGQ